jgi:hypothetical protein
MFTASKYCSLLKTSSATRFYIKGSERSCARPLSLSVVSCQTECHSLAPPRRSKSKSAKAIDLN